MALSASSIIARLAWLREGIDLLAESNLRSLAQQLSSELSFQLERGNLIDIPPSLACRGVRWLDPLDERLASWGGNPKSITRFEEYHDEVRRLSDHFQHVSSEARSSSWSWRIGEENRSLLDLGWWPFFVTLTVDPSLADARRIMEEGIEWRRYRQRVAEVVRRELGLRQPSKSGPPVADYFRYAAVVEHGGSRDHHHIHAMLWCRDIPSHWKLDPNVGRVFPCATDVLPLKSLWPWASVTKAEAFRCLGDPWSEKAGWMISVDSSGVTRSLYPPAMAGFYLTKYLTKEDKEWFHRMKATRGLGQSSLKRYLRSIGLAECLRLSYRPSRVYSESLARMSAPPTSLVRSLARQEACSRMFSANSGRKLIYRLILPMRRGSNWSRMRASVMDGQKPWRMDLAEHSDWLWSVIDEADIRVSSEKCDRAWSTLASHFEEVWSLSTSVVGGMSLQ